MKTLVLLVLVLAGCSTAWEDNYEVVCDSSVYKNAYIEINDNIRIIADQGNGNYCNGKYFVWYNYHGEWKREGDAWTYGTNHKGVKPLIHHLQWTYERRGFDIEEIDCE